jgi:hypothetical protein
VQYPSRLMSKAFVRYLFLKIAKKIPIKAPMAMENIMKENLNKIRVNRLAIFCSPFG